jgi:hypothetical protein
MAKHEATAAARILMTAQCAPPAHEGEAAVVFRRGAWPRARVARYFLSGQPSSIFAYESFDTVERDFGRLVPARFRLLMLFTSEFFFGEVFFADVFFAEVFFALFVVAAVFFAGVFFVADFFVAGRLAVAPFLALFLAGDFFVVVFLAAMGALLAAAVPFLDAALPPTSPRRTPVQRRGVVRRA